MSEEINRLKQDLEVINNAAGFGQPPLGREDVWASGLLGGAGLLWAAYAWWTGGVSLEWLTVFALVVSLAGVLLHYFKYARSGQRTVARERGYRYSWFLGIVLGVLIGGFFTWAKFFGGLKGTTFISTAFLFTGGLLVLLAVTDKWRFSFWGWAIPILLFGAFAPVMSPLVFGVLLGAAVCVGGFAAAAILSWQLRAARAREVHHAAD